MQSKEVKKWQDEEALKLGSCGDGRRWKKCL